MEKIKIENAGGFSFVKVNVYFESMRINIDALNF